MREQGTIEYECYVRSGIQDRIVIDADGNWMRSIAQIRGFIEIRNVFVDIYRSENDQQCCISIPVNRIIKITWGRKSVGS